MKNFKILLEKQSTCCRSFCSYYDVVLEFLVFEAIIAKY